ncbi:MAG: hypothetical protein IT290_11110 [Deltaproteobacteria bacterium]|nr:hypothetical protein [Deltaproteobacteria bacterium]
MTVTPPPTASPPPANLTPTERITGILFAMSVQPIDPQSARDYKRAVRRDPDGTAEPTTAWEMRPRWMRLGLADIPRGVPPVPERLTHLLGSVTARAAEEGVTIREVVHVFDLDPLVGFNFQDSGETVEVLVGGYQLDPRYRGLLKGGVLL